MTGCGRLCSSPAFQREMGMERFSLHTHFIYRKLKLSPTSSETLFRRQDSSFIESEISPISRISSETPCGDLRVGSVRAEISPSSPTSSEALCSGQSSSSVRSEISPASRASSDAPCGELGAGSVRVEISPSSPTSSEALCSGQSSALSGRKSPLLPVHLLMRLAASWGPAPPRPGFPPLPTPRPGRLAMFR